MTATARRGHGEGSIYRDAANGTWVGAISLGWRPDGTRIRRKVTGRTKTDVREKLKRLRAEADAGLKTSASYTLARAVDETGPRRPWTGDPRRRRSRSSPRSGRSRPRRAAVLEPLLAEIIPSATILQLTAQHNIEPEAEG
jgi:hypothetical protein